MRQKQLRLVEPSPLRRRIEPARPPRTAKPGAAYEREGVSLHFEDSLRLYDSWAVPKAIVVDGPYGVAGFPGDPPTVEGLTEWYRPHVAAWTARATPQTTLWFWGTEIGWATVHHLFVEAGWEYRNCHIWNKGKGHVAGNANTVTLRKFPVVTEVCVQYVKPQTFIVNGTAVAMREWLRHEWIRSGLPMYLSNKACGVKNAATRKYLTADHLWYYPPPEAFEAMANFLNAKGAPEGRPYLSMDGKKQIPTEQWAKFRPKFDCLFGVSNVWDEPAVRGVERLKTSAFKVLHTNQKPLRLIDIILRSCTDEGDVVWEPFGGLCSVAISAHKLNRKCHSAEIIPEFFLASAERLATYDA